MPITQALQEYRCHKIVRAAKIVAIERGLVLDLGPYGAIQVNQGWVEEKRAVAGGYYVVYDDGYCSFSPEKAFVDGYLPVPPDTMAPYQQRAAEELMLLLGKCKRLAAFMTSPTFTALDPLERERMTEQAQHMTGYLRVLAERVASFADPTL